jgi:peptide/nickel transport system substrate-binding protein
MGRLLRWGTVGLVALLATLGVASTAAYASSRTPAKVRAASGPSGSLTVLENSGLYGSWTGFDASDTTSFSEFGPWVLGTLFDYGPKGSLIPDLATGYKLTDGGLTLTITLRPGLTFSNGDPLNASVVATSYERWISPSTVNGVEYVGDWPMSSVTATNSTTVVVQFSHVFAGILSSWPQIIDPVALQKMGETAYNLNPIGAGPFTVQTDKPSAQLVLKANPRYWEKGYPKVETLNVETTGSDESAYEAVESGQAQVYEGLQTLGLVSQAEKSGTMKLYSIPATGTWALELNALKPPLNNIKAREALYYATDAATLDKHLFDDKYAVMQSPTGPAGLFYTPKVAGYRTYDLAKAKALVKQLGGLTVNLATVSIPLAILTDEALQAEWAKAGIKTTLEPEQLAGELTQWKAGDWNIITILAGSYDPSTGFGLPLYFGPTTFFNGTKDPALEKLLSEAQGTFDMKTRAKYYSEIFSYLSDHAYLPTLFAVPTYELTSKNVTNFSIAAGLGLVDWAHVGVKS